MLQKRATTEAYGQYISALREYLPGSNLYMREVHFIAAASPTQAISIAQIAHKMEVTPGAVSQIAARLEKKGYITRCRAPGDRRQILVSLTEDGRRLYAWHEAYDRRCMEEFAQHMLLVASRCTNEVLHIKYVIHNNSFLYIAATRLRR